MEELNKNLVAVYGTLRKDCSNHALISDSELLGSFESNPLFSLYSVSDMYPALKLGGNQSVLMEVYEVDDATLKRLDGLEGYNPNNKKHNLYDRKIFHTPYGEAYLYVYEGGVGKYELIPNGDWKEYIELKPINELIY